MSESFEYNPVVSTQWSENGVKYQYSVQLETSIGNMPFESLVNERHLYGQFSSVKKMDNSIYEVIRDPLGIGKIFYTEAKDGKIHLSPKFADLFRHKAEIFSVPPGMHVRIGSSGLRELVRKIGPEEVVNSGLNAEAFRSGEKDGEVAVFRDAYEDRLAHAFSLVRGLEDDGWSVFIALSGGLDSSIIAKKAAAYLSKPIACTLDLGKSEDAEKSVYIARYLGIEHLVFGTNESEILGMLNKAPLLCQDFRDFNVHCAALNLLLAKNIRTWVDNANSKVDKNKIIVLTGDLMNEYTCDYAGEIIDQIEYYKLPKVGKKDLQTYLIRGLDTSDREVSPFDYYGLKCIQPYAILYDLFTSLDESVLEVEDPKKLINSFLVEEEIRNLIPKTKLRAQVGSRENMGILGVCHKLGMNDKYFLTNLFKAAGIQNGNIPIFVGKYDVESFN